MHDHDNKDKGMGSMMWMMIICCAVPLVLILLFGLGGKSLGGPNWIVFGGVAVMLLVHFFMMRGHGHSNEGHDKQGIADGEDKKDKNHSNHGSCH